MTQGRQSGRNNLEAAYIEIAELRAELESERKKRLAAQRRATLDELTRLHTRRAFDEDGKPRFQRTKRGRISVAMFFIDANAFKTVNDTHGHAAGDELLVAIARTIGHNMRPEDLSGQGSRKNIAGRKGGDEFVLFFETLDEDGARIVARRIYEAVEAIRLKRAPNLRASVSIGVAVGVPPADLRWNELIAQADVAMYKAKALRGTGQPTICIRPIIT